VALLVARRRGRVAIGRGLGGAVMAVAAPRRRRLGRLPHEGVVMTVAAMMAVVMTARAGGGGLMVPLAGGRRGPGVMMVVVVVMAVGVGGGSLVVPLAGGRGGLGVMMMMVVVADPRRGRRRGQGQGCQGEEGRERGPDGGVHAVNGFQSASRRPEGQATRPRRSFNTMGTSPGKSSLIRPGPKAWPQAAWIQAPAQAASKLAIP